MYLSAIYQTKLIYQIILLIPKVTVPIFNKYGTRTGVAKLMCEQLLGTVLKMVPKMATILGMVTVQQIVTVFRMVTIIEVIFILEVVFIFEVV